MTERSVYQMLNSINYLTKIKIGSPLSAQQTFKSTNMVTLPTTICSSLQPLTPVVGFYFSLSLTYVSTRVSNFISILSVINHFT